MVQQFESLQAVSGLFSVDDVVITNGFSQEGDGGGAEYIVRQRDPIYSDPNYIGEHAGFDKGHQAGKIVSFKFNLYTCINTYGDHTPFDKGSPVFEQIAFNAGLQSYDSSKDYAVDAQFNKDGVSYKVTAQVWGRHKKYTSWDANRNTDRRLAFIQTSAQRAGVPVRFSLLREKALIEDDKTIIRIPGTDNVLQLTASEIDIKQVGAKENVKFRINKNKGYFVTPTPSDYDNTPNIQAAIDYASTFGIKNVVCNGHYFCSGNKTIDLFGDVNFRMNQTSGLHSFAEVPQLIIFSQFGTDHSINLYNINNYAFVPTATKNLPKVSVKGDFTNMSAVIHYLRESDIYQDGTKSDGDAYYSEGSTFDNLSAGVVFYNCRQVKLLCEIEKFCENLVCFGYADGGAENTILLKRIFNGRYGIAVRSENGGWCNSNFYLGGSIKLDGQNNRDYSIPCDSCAIYNEGNSNVFDSINLEGNQNYTRLIDSRSSDNSFRNNRYEGIRSGQIYLSSLAVRNQFIGGYSLTSLHMTAKSPIVGPGNLVVKDNGVELYGPVFVGPGRLNTASHLLGGSLALGGNIGDGAGGSNFYNGLIVKSQNNNPALGDLVSIGGNSSVPFLGVLIVDGLGNLKYYGQGGKSLLKTFQDKGIYYDLDANGGYTAGRWVTIGYKCTYNGQTYLCLRIGQLSGNQSVDFTDSTFWIVNPATALTDPLIEYNQQPPYFRPSILGPKNGQQTLLWDQVVRYSKATAITGTSVDFKAIGQVYLRVDPASHLQEMNIATSNWNVDDEVVLHNVSVANKSFVVPHGGQIYLPGNLPVTINPGGSIWLKKVQVYGGSRINAISILEY